MGLIVGLNAVARCLLMYSDSLSCYTMKGIFFLSHAGFPSTKYEKKKLADILPYNGAGVAQSV
jgi:hypothetical protein